MDQLLFGLVIRYLVIAVALLHASRGQRPRLRVIYGLNDVDNDNLLECIDDHNLIRSGATYRFRNPVTEETEGTVDTDGLSYRFTIQPSNESLITCQFSDSEESDHSQVMVAAIPQYRAGVTAITQYIYSDSGVAEIECPFPLGRLSSLYEFLWQRVLSSGLGVPITNGTWGVYWLTEEYNRTLYISAAPDRRFRCIGVVQTCSGTSLCRLERRDSPVINITETTDLAIITDSPASVIVNESETATFNCTATGVGDLTIEWNVGGELYNCETCSESPHCDSINSESNDGYVTSTLEITGETDLDIRCVLNQDIIISSGEPGVETRWPPPRTVQGEAARITVIPAVTTTATTQPMTTQGPGVDPNAENPRLQAEGIYTITGVVGGIILIIILIFAVCIFCMFCYHYKDRNSVLGQKLRRAFSRNSTRQKLHYDLPGDVIATTSYQSQTQDDDISDQTNRLNSMDATSAAGVRMQENRAYQPSTNFTLHPNPAYVTNVAIAPEIATERNVAYKHTTTTTTM